MSEYLTTRQVQDILKVDRITIYRMLQDGRLQGVKIGQQWRFARTEVERLLNVEVQPNAPETSLTSDATFPTHCIQTVQNLFSSVSQLSALAIDRQGGALTRTSSPCKFCRMMCSSPSGLSTCQNTWQKIAQASASGQRGFTCHAGLQYLSAPVQDSGALAGWVLVGEIYLGQLDPVEEAERVRRLAETHNLPVGELQAAARMVPVLPDERRPQLEGWIAAAAQATESILQERAGFMQRLQRIADLTQVSQEKI